MLRYPYRVAPENGAQAFARATPIPDDPRFLGTTDDSVVVIYPTRPGVYHGVEIAWDDLREQWRHALIRAGLVSRSGPLKEKKIDPSLRSQVVMASQSLKFPISAELEWQILLYEDDPTSIGRLDWCTVWLNARSSGLSYCVEGAEELESTLSQIEIKLHHALAGHLEMECPLHLAELWALHYAGQPLPSHLAGLSPESLDLFFAMHRLFSMPNAQPDTWIFTRGDHIFLEVVESPQMQPEPRIARFSLTLAEARTWLAQLADIRARYAPYPWEAEVDMTEPAGS